MSQDLDRRRFLALAAGVGVASAVGLPRVALAGPGGARPVGEWIAGDFHCHSTYSHDVWSGPGDDNTGDEEFYTHGHTPGEQITLAELRGLDFLAITDPTGWSPCARRTTSATTWSCCRATSTRSRSPTTAGCSCRPSRRCRTSSPRTPGRWRSSTRCTPAAAWPS